MMNGNMQYPMMMMQATGGQMLYPNGTPMYPQGQQPMMMMTNAGGMSYPQQQQPMMMMNAGGMGYPQQQQAMVTINATTSSSSDLPPSFQEATGGYPSSAKY